MTRQTLARSNPAAAAVLVGIAIMIGSVSASAATLEIAGPPGASCAVDGRSMGFLPLDGPLDLRAGRHVITGTLPGHQPYRQEVRLQGADSWQRVVMRLTPYSRRTAWSSNLLLAGLGPIYLGHRTRGLAYAVAESGGLLTALAGELIRSNARSEYLVLLDDYRSAINADEILRLRNATEAKYRDMSDARDLRNLGLIVAGGAVALSVLDAMLSFPHVATGAGPVPPRVGGRDRDPGGGELAFHAGWRLGF